MHEVPTMDVIQSRIDTSSDLFKKNYEAMEALVEDLRHEMKRAMEDRSEKAKNRLKESGKIPAQRKLDLLLDKNTPFLETSPLAGKDMYDGKVHKAGLITGIGIVEGREVFVSINDATIKGGAGYPISAKKGLRGQTICMENRLPSINLVDSAGAFLPLQSQMFPDIDGGGRIFYNQALMSKMGIPQIAAVMGHHGGGQQDAAVEVGQHPGRAGLGRVDAQDGEAFGPNLLDAPVQLAVGLEDQRLEVDSTTLAAAAAR